MRLRLSNAGGAGSIPGQRTKIPSDPWPKGKKKNLFQDILQLQEGWEIIGKRGWRMREAQGGNEVKEMEARVSGEGGKEWDSSLVKGRVLDMGDEFEVSLSEKNSRVFPILLFSWLLEGIQDWGPWACRALCKPLCRNTGIGTCLQMCASWWHMKCYCFTGWCHVGQNKRTGKERAGVAMGRSGNLQPDTVSTGKFPTSNAVSVWREVSPKWG